MPEQPSISEGRYRRFVNTHQPQPLAAVVMAAGLGTRMRSSTPKVLHPICGRPMLAYVLDAAVAATGSRPLVVICPPVAPIAEVFAERGRLRHPGRAARHRRRHRRGPRDAARRTSTRSSCSRATCPSSMPSSWPSWPPAGATTTPPWPSSASTWTTRPASVASCAVRTVASPASSSTRTPAPAEREIDEINSGLYAFDADWLRRRIGDVEPSPVTGELYLPELIPLARAGRSARGHARGRGRRHAAGHQRPRPAGRRRAGDAPAHQRGAHARRRDDAWTRPRTYIDAERARSPRT